MRACLWHGAHPGDACRVFEGETYWAASRFQKLEAVSRDWQQLARSEVSFVACALTNSGFGFVDASPPVGTHGLCPRECSSIDCMD